MEYDEFLACYKAITPGLEAFRRKLKQHMLESVDSLPHIDRFQCRVKLPDSAYNKYTSKYRYSEDPFSEFEDLVAARFIVFFISDIGKVRGRLLDHFKRIERSEKRPEFDDQFGYESEHLVFATPAHLKPSSSHEFCPNSFELQIRTILMHAYAEPQHDIYKRQGEVPKDITRRLAWIAASCWGADREYEELRAWSSGEKQSSLEILIRK